MRRPPLVAAVIGVSLVVAACGQPHIRHGGTPLSDTGVLRADVARQRTDAATGPLVDGLTKFGHELIAAVDAPSKNTVLSPLSIALAMSMARAGAGGVTAAEIDRVLHFPAADRDAAFNTLTRGLVTVDGPPPRPDPQATRSPDAPPVPPVVAVANGLFAQAGPAVGKAFLRTLAAHYAAGLRTVDFGSGQGAEVINDWARRQTAERIRRVFDSLDPSTQLVIVNAIYLKADWAQPFREHETWDEPFTLGSGSRARVPTLHRQGTFRYAAGPGWQAVEVPYAGGRLAMWVLVPSGTTTPVDLLAPAALRTVAAELHDEPIELALPRWDFGTNLDLVPALERLGLAAPFRPDADFAGISPGLFLNQAAHVANITVDEWGTEAAAVTGLAFIVSAPAPPQIVVRADHPFAFAVVDRTTQAPLFIGTVADPSMK